MKSLRVPFGFFMALVSCLASLVVRTRSTKPIIAITAPLKNMKRQIYLGGMPLQSSMYVMIEHKAGHGQDTPPEPNKYSNATFRAPFEESAEDSALCAEASGY